MTFPMPADRCSLKIGKRYVNGLVVSVLLRLRKPTRITVRVDPVWRTRQKEYTVPLAKLAGWSKYAEYIAAPKPRKP